MIKKYIKEKNGEIAYKFVAYLGVDPETGKQVRTTRQGFKTEREALLAQAKLIEEYEQNRGWKKSIAVTVDDVAKLWFEQYQNTVKPSTYMITENNYKNHILSAIGKTNIKKLTVLSCQKMAMAISSLSGYGNIYSVANRILKFAVHMDLIETNPMDKVIKPKGTHVPKSESFENFYTKEQLDEFLEIVEEQRPLEDLVLFRILSMGGLRIGETIVLDEYDFDFNDNTIDINKTLAYTKNGWVIQAPKTKKSKRKLDMDAETMRLAKEYIYSLPKPLHSARRLFNITTEAVRYRLDKITETNNLERITPHGFRHTHASLLYDAGVPAKVAQERLGHAKISITLDLYTHLSKRKKDDAIEKLFEYIA
ncbi:site-specific integrase [Streptococcus ovis]|uniref:site-specific integrase n=1 Tax=Streptococcus ovis TaxID=82806 RepID=UPI00037D3E23|nr:site-specific integrase [Streptococcus ovis]